MHLFTADAWTGSVRTTAAKGCWVDYKDRLAALPQWAGDRIFLDLLRQEAPFFSLKLRYQGNAGLCLPERKGAGPVTVLVSACLLGWILLVSS